MTSNVGTLDRLFRLILGVALIALPFIGGLALFDTTIATVISVVLGVVMLVTSAMRYCPLYRIFGVRTCKVS